MLNDLKARRTRKILAHPDNPLPSDGFDRSKIERLLEAAGNAPFHYACDRPHQLDLPSPVPWRATALETKACRALMQLLLEAGDQTKVPHMLAAASALVQVTWLPDGGDECAPPSDKDTPAFAGTLRNMEHVAAAGGFAQSLLLAAEAEGFHTYWSSGGPLRSHQVFDWLHIPKNQILIGSVFLYPRDACDTETKPGAMADKRGGITDWARWATFE